MKKTILETIEVFVISIAIATIMNIISGVGLWGLCYGAMDMAVLVAIVLLIDDVAFKFNRYRSLLTHWEYWAGFAFWGSGRGRSTSWGRSTWGRTHGAHGLVSHLTHGSTHGATHTKANAKTHHGSHRGGISGGFLHNTESGFLLIGVAFACTLRGEGFGFDGHRGGLALGFDRRGGTFYHRFVDNVEVGVEQLDVDDGEIVDSDAEFIEFGGHPLLEGLGDFGVMARQIEGADPLFADDFTEEVREEFLDLTAEISFQIA